MASETFRIKPATQRLSRLARQSVPDDDLPQLPKSYAQGCVPAIEFARVSIARSIIRDRQAAGLSQQELARLAGVRQETISRLESGKHSPTIRTVEKIDRVLRQSLKNGRKRSGGRRGR